MPTIKARKAQIEASSIKKTKTPKLHQTNTHNAQTHVASKKVEVTVVKQYSTKSDNKERPKEGSKYYGNSAIISSRKTNYLGPADNPGRTKGVFEDNVIIDLKAKNNLNNTSSNGTVNNNKTKKKSR